MTMSPSTSTTTRKHGCAILLDLRVGTFLGEEETMELPGDRDNTGARRRGRPRTAWMDNINTWTDK